MGNVGVVVVILFFFTYWYFNQKFVLVGGHHGRTLSVGSYFETYMSLLY